MIKAKEHPIVLTAQEVNAVLAGNKTQHRVPVLTAKEIDEGFDWDYGAEGDAAIFYNYAEDGISIEETLLVDCPFSAEGDRLWVQEDWRVGAWKNDRAIFAVDYKASPELTNTPWLQVDSTDDLANWAGFRRIWMQTVDELCSKGVMTDNEGHYHWPAGQAPLDWQPASSMERWASRLLLEITDIRIERVQDITHNDSVGEAAFTFYPKQAVPPLSAFPRYWMEKHGDDAWRLNPWVWVIEFKKVNN